MVNIFKVSTNVVVIECIKICFTIEAVSKYFLYGVLALQDLLRFVVSLCPGSGALVTEILGLAL